MTPAPLARSRDERMLAGVCAGLARHLGVPMLWVRAGMLALAFFGGAGALFYLWLWATVPWEGGEVAPMRRALTRPATVGAPVGAALVAAPAVDSGSAAAASPEPPREDPAGERGATGRAPATSDDEESRAARRARWPVAELLLGGALLAVGVVLVLTQLGVQLDLAVLLPGLVVLVGVGLTWWQIADRDRPERHQLPRVLGALALVAVGVLMFFVTSRQPSALTVIAAAFAVLAGVALALAPWVLRINRELIAERSGRAREAERAEIAAHLHDSVLQTLAAIQQRSEPGSEVARLARGQERELRDWLFRTADGADPPPREAVDVELRAHAAALEAGHAARFEVVSVGTGSGAVAPEAIVAATREAMLNAARHAGGEVTVYIEASPSRISIDVTDRGPGLDPAALPEGRMGVRESIIGRMERAGGTARIVQGPGGAGTSVRLAMPLSQDERGADARA